MMGMIVPCLNRYANRCTISDYYKVGVLMLSI